MMNDAVSSSPGADLEVAIWRVPAAEVPRKSEEIRAFLLAHCRRVDRFAGGAAVEEPGFEVGTAPTRRAPIT